MAKTKQKIKEEAMQVKVIERTQQIQLQEQEIIRRERELEAQVRKPAEAEKYRLEKLAEANRFVMLEGNMLSLDPGSRPDRFICRNKEQGEKGNLLFDRVSEINEPRSEKSGLQGFRSGPTQTGLYSHRRWLEA